MSGGVVYGTVDAFGCAALPELNPLTQGYVMEQLQNIIPAMGNIGNAFVEKAKQAYQALTDSSVMQRARAALRMTAGVKQPDVVSRLMTLEDLQGASLLEQRFIMANPVIRAQFHKQRCDGYTGTYFDLEPEAIGESHYDYRRLMSGVVEDYVNEAAEDCTRVRFFMDDLKEGDKDLSPEEKAFHLTNGEIAAMFLKAGMDATDSFGN